MPPMSADSLHPVALDAEPIDVVRRLRNLEGLVFLDTVVPAAGEANHSIVAVEPRRILRGRTRQDWEELSAEVNKLTEAGSWRSDIPESLLAGCVDYDGSFFFCAYTDLLVYDHRDGRWFAAGDLHDRLASVKDLPPAAASAKPRFVAELSRERYCALVRKAQEYISAGDIYQVNLARRFAAPWCGEAFKLYESLRRHSPAPYGAFLKTPKRTVLSSSPESFLAFNRRHVRTRPIKGTRPRFADPITDQTSSDELVHSPKETAEIVMITDLERNDLGAVCEYGTVRVRELAKLERFEQVFHLVSTVEGVLRPEIDHVTALRRCFPGGSITGAPKKRAMEIIAELEPASRGLYTGAIGYFGSNGVSEFSIAIRTMIGEGDMLHFHTGAGIVADSIPDEEFEETMHKAAGILLAAERMNA